MVELLEETRANTEYIRSKGYRVVEIWECKWPQMKRTTAFYRHGSPQNLRYDQDYELGGNIE